MTGIRLPSSIYHPIEGAVSATGVDSVLACQVKWEVVCVTLMHNFHTQTSTIKYICPGVQNTTLTINNGLIEVESVEVERHGGDAEGGKPDSHDELCCEEEVQ